MKNLHLQLALLLSLLSLTLSATSYAAPQPESPALFNAVAKEGTDSGLFYIKPIQEHILLQVPRMRTGPFMGLKDVSKFNKNRKDAKRDIQSIKTYIEDEQIDINAMITQALSEEFSNIDWLKSVEVISAKDKAPSLSSLRQKHDLTSDLLTTASFSYYLSPAFEYFEVYVDIHAYKTMRYIYKEHGVLDGDNVKTQRKVLSYKYKGKKKKLYYRSKVMYQSAWLPASSYTYSLMTKQEQG